MMEKGRALGLSLMPVLMWLFVQCAVVLGFPSIMNWLGSVLSALGADTGGFYSFLEINDTYCIYILMDALVLIPGVLWFRRLPAREEKKQGGFFGISPGGVLLLVLAGLALQLLSNFLLTMIFTAFPELMESYSQVLENLGMYSPTVLSLLYTTAVAPLAEELLFRGLTLRILEEAFPFWAANLLQAFYFGLIHGNLVQGGYAFGAGMLLGYLVKKKGTLAVGILCHFGVNFSGVILGLL